MIAVAHTIVYELAVVVEAFHAAAARHTMGGGAGPKAAAEEAEIFEVSLFANSSIKCFVELRDLNAGGVARIFAMSNEEKYD